MRLRAKESLVEVSAAIELPEDRLGLIEKGELRPSEDIMELFIMHFTVQENEADKLWELAGYGDKKPIQLIIRMKKLIPANRQFW